MQQRKESEREGLQLEGGGGNEKCTAIVIVPTTSTTNFLREGSGAAAAKQAALSWWCFILLLPPRQGHLSALIWSTLASTLPPTHCVAAPPMTTDPYYIPKASGRDFQAVKEIKISPPTEECQQTLF